MSASKLLIVEDNPAIRKLVRATLEARGHIVLEAPDAKTGLALLVAERPRIVLQDLVLPDGDGFALVEQMRRIGGDDLVLLAVSGYVSRLEETRLSAVGFDDLIIKPIEPSQLIRVVESHLPMAGGAPEQFGTGRRLLVAEDDPIQRKLTVFKLSRLGFRIQAVENGEIALAALHEQRPDAVVADVMMPKMDGFRLALALRQDHALKDLPLVLVTSNYVEPSDRDLARRAGANELVLRAPDLRELIAELRHQLTARPPAPALPPEVVPQLEREREHAIVRQLERQVRLNMGLANRCSMLASELRVLGSISDAVLNHRDVGVALDDALTAYFDAAGISAGALYTWDEPGKLTSRVLGSAPPWGPESVDTFFGYPDLLGALMRRPIPTFIPSSDVPPAVSRDLADRVGAPSMLVVPLLHQQSQLGALFMVPRGPELDVDDWRAVATAVGSQIVQVLLVAKAYEERELAVRARDEFLSIASHEFKTPLTPLELQLESALRVVRSRKNENGDVPAEGLESRLLTAAGQVKKFATLVNGLLDVTRMTPGHLTARPQTVDLREMVEGMVQSWDAMLERTGSTITVSASAPARGNWDPTYLETVVRNLLANALKFGNGQPIEIAVEADQRRARLVVKDHGIGVAPQDRARIFQRFERGVSARNFGGLGIGLWVVKQAVEAHGGTVLVEDTAGGGATFVVELPTHPAFAFTPGAA